MRNSASSSSFRPSSLLLFRNTYSTIAATVLSAYVSVWVFIYLLIHRVMNEGGRKVLGAPCIVMAVEVVKCFISFILFCKRENEFSFVRGFKELVIFFRSRNSVKMVMLYAPVALLYAVYNNLMLVNLKSHHPTVYLILSTSRVLMVAYAWQIVFNVKISQMKKLGLVAIVLGIVAKGVFAEQDLDNVGVTALYKSLFSQEDHIHVPKMSSEKFQKVLFGSALVIFQMACSVIVSVYNEKLLKDNPCNQQLQNICLYINSIAVNAIFFAATKWMSRGAASSIEKDSSGDASSIFTPSVILLVFNLALSGIITSFVLRYVNSLTKSVASATETIFTYLIEVCFFQYGLEYFEALSVILVTIGAIVYAADKKLMRSADDVISEELPTTKNNFTSATKGKKHLLNYSKHLKRPMKGKKSINQIGHLGWST
mmetsp:Transcript_17226/g.25297  ORF Transcript_17226/g.25297 Transcript_17226/m.25297 type:complete len:427 (-) Transcript_17226:358-1638(-)